MAQTAKEFQWPVVLESRACALVGSRVFEPLLRERKSANEAIWDSKSSWKLGFYFGHGDTRLWVPRKGKEDDELLIINFAHPLGRRAFRVLMLGYAIGAVTLGLVVTALLGIVD